MLVADLVDRLRLGHEARHHLRIARQFRVDRLHGDLASDDRVLRQVDDTHPALAELGCDRVVADRLTDSNQR